MNHSVEAFGFRLAAGGRVLAYSADTGESPALVKLAAGADLMLCEASFVESKVNPPNLHLTGAEAGTIAAKAGVGRLLITHLVPWNDQDRVLAEPPRPSRAIVAGPAGPYGGRPTAARTLPTATTVLR